jgi:S-DNA-T family DNA segregation ATPase FtsK/SpoIIIE
VISKISANVSNYFMNVHDVGAALNDVMSMNTGYIFGAEYQWLNGELDQLLITPPSIRFGEPSTVDRVIEYEKDLTFYEGYLSKPYFMPIYTKGKGLFANEILDLNLSREDIVSIQILFKKKKDYWRKNAHSMFGSYLMGNDYPASSLVARFMQDKLISILEKVSPIEVYNEYIEDVENKILNALGYQFHFRVAIKSPYHVDIKNQIMEVLQKYNSHNTFELHPTKAKHFQTHFSGCVVTGSSDNQVLCYDEVMSLFSDRTGAVTEAPKAPVVVEVGDVMKLLPELPRVAPEVDVHIIPKLAEAMKRVGLIDKARLYNESLVTGIRLSVIECDIPKSLNFSKLRKAQNDIQVALGVPSLGIDQGGKPDSVRFSVPLEKQVIVTLREMLESPEFQEFRKKKSLAFVVGLDEVGNPIFLSLAELVHLLVAGTTGSGKSVFINGLALSLILTHTPDELRLIMIDPKQVELRDYADFPHVENVITDMDEAEDIFKKLVKEMDDRYTKFTEHKGVREIAVYNEVAEEKMPYIIVVIDEYADLHDTNPEVEKYIARLGQKARAAGIHIVLATQRPDATILEGRIKANIRNAISFNLGDNNNYKTVFGYGIPYKLLGNGDGVMRIEGYKKDLQRFQSSMFCPVKTKEGEAFERLAEHYQKLGYEVKPLFPDDDEEEEGVVTNLPEESPLDRVKKHIAQTGETKVEEIRKALEISTNTLTGLMLKLVEQGWLVKHKSRAKGYELIATEEMMAEYKE